MQNKTSKELFQSYDQGALQIQPPWKITEDLHLHTTASDGMLSPQQLVNELEKFDIRIAMISDHDTVSGLDEALNYATTKNVTIIKGIEFSSQTGYANLHLLAAFIDHKHPKLLNAISNFQRERIISTKQSIAKLRSLGFEISYNQVKSYAQGTVGRPHIARALIANNYVKTFPEAFDKYLTLHKPGYVPGKATHLQEHLDLIEQIGGVSIIAHPRTVHNLEELLAEYGNRIDGMEVYAEKYNKTQIDYLLELCNTYDMIPTGGSDYHCQGFKNEVVLGMQGPPTGTTKRLYQRAELKLNNHLGQSLTWS